MNLSKAATCITHLQTKKHENNLIRVMQRINELVLAEAVLLLQSIKGILIVLIL